MRHPQGGGLTAQRQQVRERLRLEAAERFALNPSLSAETLVGLLLDPHSAEATVHNPAIPTPVMDRMVELSTPLLNIQSRARR